MTSARHPKLIVNLTILSNLQGWCLFKGHVESKALLFKCHARIFDSLRSVFNHLCTANVISNLIRPRSSFLCSIDDCVSCILDSSHNCRLPHCWIKIQILHAVHSSYFEETRYLKRTQYIKQSIAAYATFWFSTSERYPRNSVPYRYCKLLFQFHLWTCAPVHSTIVESLSKRTKSDDDDVVDNFCLSCTLSCAFCV